MSKPSLEKLAEKAAAGDRTAADLLLSRLITLFYSFDEKMLDRVTHCANVMKERQGRGQVPSQVEPALASAPLTPELLEWARSQFNEEEAVASLREMRATGGLTFDDLLPELERGVQRS
jgi:hypothetical protein